MGLQPRACAGSGQAGRGQAGAGGHGLYTQPAEEGPARGLQLQRRAHQVLNTSCIALRSFLEATAPCLGSHPLLGVVSAVSCTPAFLLFFRSCLVFSGARALLFASTAIAAVCGCCDQAESATLLETSEQAYAPQPALFCIRTADFRLHLELVCCDRS